LLSYEDAKILVLEKKDPEFLDDLFKALDSNDKQELGDAIFKAEE